MQPIEIACRFSEPGVDGRNCGASAGEPCRFLAPTTQYHAERIEDAASIGQVEDTSVSIEAFDLAVENSGEV